MRNIFALLIIALLIAPATAMGAAIDDLEKKISELTDEIDYLHERIDKTEMHTATDRISFYGDLRSKADHLRYSDITINQGAVIDFDKFGMDAMGGAFGNPMDPASPIGQMMQKYPDLAAKFMSGALPSKGFFGPGVEKFDDNNDILYTTRMRLGMKAKVWENVNFSGRLLMYKNWGDSTGTKVMDSFDAFTMDGTSSSDATGDEIHVERAYFDWKNINDSNFYLSIGRRPSSYGPPSHIRENELRGGTPSGHLVHFNFDGITVGYKLGEITGWEGQTVRFCYGQGYESQFGTGSLFAEADVDDTHLGGFNVDLLNDGTNLVQLTLFGAKDVTDSFKGVAVLPFADTNNDGIPDNIPNTLGYVSRFQGSTNVGDIILGGVGYVREQDNGMKYFVSGGWTRALGNSNYNKMGFGGMMADADPVYQVDSIDADGNPQTSFTGEYLTNGLDEDRDGFSIYIGTQIPAPMGKFGLEYNYGSKYWSPFTQAQDDIVGSKLATRGHVGEAYYIFDINPNMFIKTSAIYYDYEYTGSGSPVGMPKKVDDVQNGTAFSMFPAIDTVWDINASVTVKF